MKGQKGGDGGTEDIVGTSLPLSTCYMGTSSTVSRREPTGRQVLPFLMAVNLTLPAPFNTYYFI